MWAFQRGEMEAIAAEKGSTSRDRSKLTPVDKPSRSLNRPRKCALIDQRSSKSPSAESSRSDGAAAANIALAAGLASGAGRGAETLAASTRAVAPRCPSKRTSPGPTAASSSGIRRSS